MRENSSIQIIKGTLFQKYKIMKFVRYIKVLFIVIILLPFILILLPFILIAKTIATVFQQYFYKLEMKRYEKKSKEWNELYQENRRKGIYIDFPPERPECGTFLGFVPWGKEEPGYMTPFGIGSWFKVEEDEEEDFELIGD